MSTTTPNLNLIKPAGTDFVNVADLNSNFDIIDTKFGNFTGTVKDIKDSVTPQNISITATSNINNGYISGIKIGKLCIVNMYCSTVAINAWQDGFPIATLSETMDSTKYVGDGIVYVQASSICLNIYIYNNELRLRNKNSVNLNSGSWIFGQYIFPCV